MTIPAAAFIEMAKDELAKERLADTAAKCKELHVAMGAMSEEAIKGYLLGVKTKEIMAQIMPPQIVYPV